MAEHDYLEESEEEYDVFAEERDVMVIKTFSTDTVAKQLHKNAHADDLTDEDLELETVPTNKLNSPRVPGYKKNLQHRSILTTIIPTTTSTTPGIFTVLHAQHAQRESLARLDIPSAYPSSNNSSRTASPSPSTPTTPRSSLAPDGARSPRHRKTPTEETSPRSPFDGNGNGHRSRKSSTSESKAGPSSTATGGYPTRSSGGMTHPSGKQMKPSKSNPSIKFTIHHDDK